MVVSLSRIMQPIEIVRIERIGLSSGNHRMRDPCVHAAAGFGPSASADIEDSQRNQARKLDSIQADHCGQNQVFFSPFATSISGQPSGAARFVQRNEVCAILPYDFLRIFRHFFAMPRPFWTVDYAISSLSRSCLQG